MKKKRAATKKPPAPLSPLQSQRQIEALDWQFDGCHPKASAGSGGPPSRLTGKRLRRTGQGYLSSSMAFLFGTCKSYFAFNMTLPQTNVPPSILKSRFTFSRNELGVPSHFMICLLPALSLTSFALRC